MVAHEVRRLDCQLVSPVTCCSSYWPCSLKVGIYEEINGYHFSGQLHRQHPGTNDVTGKTFCHRSTLVLSKRKEKNTHPEICNILQNDYLFSMLHSITDLSSFLDGMFKNYISTKLAHEITMVKLIFCNGKNQFSN